MRSRLLDFAWDQWVQMGIFGSPTAPSRWVQDPEALLLFTLEVARSDPRLMDEVLDWVALNLSIVSVQRLRNLCQTDRDRDAVNAALDWAGHHRSAATKPRADGQATAVELQPLFRGTRGVRDPDPHFAAHGLGRPRLERTGKSTRPRPDAPINLAFRLRLMLGVGARAEVVRFLMTTEAPRTTAAVIANAAYYAKRNVSEALGALHEAQVVSRTDAGGVQHFALDRDRWGTFFEIQEPPAQRDWPELLRAAAMVLRFADARDPAGESAYLRASRAVDVLELLRPDMTYAGLTVAARPTVETSIEDVDDAARELLGALAAPIPA